MRTRLSCAGIPGRPYGVGRFVGKAHARLMITRLSCRGTPGHPYGSFAGKAPSAGSGDGRRRHLTLGLRLGM